LVVVVYVFGMLTALMLSLLVIILLLYRSMKLLERIADLLSHKNTRARWLSTATRLLIFAECTAPTPRRRPEPAALEPSVGTALPLVVRARGA
jgi:hypothetical protein